MKARSPLVLAIAGVCAFALIGQPAEKSLGDQIKKIFQPTPTPAPRKHRKTAGKKVSPSASPSRTPRRHKKASPTPTPEETATPSARKKRKTSPTPSPTEAATPSPSETPEPHESSTPTPRKKGAPVSIGASEIAGYENYPAKVRQIVDLALDLANRGLEYKYGSANPESGGMDCSGFVYYVLTTVGVADVPRDSSEQYAWLRKAKTFEAVISRRDDTFELADLQPGDLLFWTGTYQIERDPPITHAMIYLGREKGTGHRIMVGASDGRTYRGESRYGVSVFDFKVSPPARTEEGRLSPTFVGYGRIPGAR